MDGGGETPRTTAVQTLEHSRKLQQRKTSDGLPSNSLVEGGKEPRPRADTPEGGVERSSVPSAKRFKPIPATNATAKHKPVAKGARTPAIVTEPTSTRVAAQHTGRDIGSDKKRQHSSHDKKMPASVGGGREIESSGSISPSSDISSGSSTHNQRKFNVSSPVPSSYAQEVPPAPPSTPASNPSTTALDPGLATPLPFHEGVRNATWLEQQQMLLEGGVTPAPTKPESSGGRVLPMSEDFSEWAVGDRYEMIRILGRGSYGEVAQAVDKYAGRPDAYVAIKRILSPFDQEIDAVRLYREIHILRRLRGHSCIINLLDVVQPPTDDLDDFHDLYLVFECMLQRHGCAFSCWVVDF